MKAPNVTWTGLFFLVVVLAEQLFGTETVATQGAGVVAVLAGLYLDVSSRAAISGRDIQSLELAIAANERSNADLETQLASLLSNQTFEARAVALGYQPLTRDDLDYVLVPGYIPDNSVHLTMESQQEGRIANEPAFQQSLLEWIAQQLESASAPLPQ